MFNLTRQEKIVLLFLIITFLIGFCLHYTLKISPKIDQALRLIDSEKIYSKVDLNRATYEELIRLPEIGPAIAQRILDYRKAQGLFTDLDEIKTIKGVSEARYQRIVKFLKVNPAS